MKIGISGIGLWGLGLNNWNSFLTGTQHGFASPDTKLTAPSPTVIPARERRRAPLSVKLAIEVIDQAASMAGVDQATLCSVFSSCVGDNHITDYICRTLAGAEKVLSPTRFHNSVHNVASGYWSISANNRHASTFVSAYEDSFALALLEAAAVCLIEKRPTVLAVYDVAFGKPLDGLYRIREDFAAALLLTPDYEGAKWGVDLEVRHGEYAPSTVENHFLAERIKNNDAAKALILIEALSSSKPSPHIYAMNAATDSHSHLSIAIR